MDRGYVISSAFIDELLNQLRNTRYEFSAVPYSNTSNLRYDFSNLTLPGYNSSTTPTTGVSQRHDDLLCKGVYSQYYWYTHPFRPFIAAEVEMAADDIDTRELDAFLKTFKINQGGVVDR